MTDRDQFYVQLDGPATIEDYHWLMEQRVLKFRPEDVSYSPQPKHAEVCRTCVHFFKGEAAHRNTCELMRPHSETESVAPCGWCRFHTTDYQTFGIIDKENKS